MHVLSRPRVASAAPLAIGFLAVLTLGAACGKRPGAPAGGPPAAADACAKYSDALCEQAGKESPTCQSVKAATGIMPPEACQAGLAKLDFSKAKLADARKTCDQLADKLCAEFEKGSATCTTVRERTKQFPPEQCQNMMTNYAQVLAEVKRMDEASKPLTPEKQAKIAADDAPSFGPKDAKVTIVEFSDFECPYCTQAAQATKKIKEKYGDKVRFVFRQFPLSFHPNAQNAAEASLAAHKQGKFWAFHDKLFENQKALTEADLKRHAKDVGLNVAAVEKALKEDTYKDQVAKDMALGGEVGVSGTPTMFLNGKRVQNATQFEAIEPMIKEALGGS
jgi:protein-disulfide isomerase